MKCQNPKCNKEAAINTKGKQLKHCSIKCRGQGNSLLSREKAKDTWIKKYGVENPQQVKEIKERTNRTVQKIYGVANVSQAKIIKEKKKQTTFKNYGVEHPLQSNVIKDNVKKTNLERYGCENVFQSEEIKDKMKETYLAKYGVEFPGQVDAIKQKIKETLLENYGVENPSHSAIVQRRIIASGVKRKEYVMPSGKIVLVQGYENKALDYLLQEYQENDIIVGEPEKIPVIDYVDADGKARRYFPDIYIPKDNLLVEVKSTYTYEKDKQRNLKKKAACEELGYKFKFYIG